MSENERIKEIRTQKGLTLAKFGERIGLSPGAVSDMERGRRGVTDQTRRSICREFRVNEEWLREGIGEMFLPDASDEIEALTKRYNLSHGIQIFIEKLANADPAVQDAVTSLIVETARAIEASEVSANYRTRPEEDSTEAAEAAYREALGIAPPMDSTASNTTDATRRVNERRA